MDLSIDYLHFFKEESQLKADLVDFAKVNKCNRKGTHQ